LLPQPVADASHIHPTPEICSSMTLIIRVIVVALVSIISACSYISVNETTQPSIATAAINAETENTETENTKAKIKTQGEIRPSTQVSADSVKNLDGSKGAEPSLPDASPSLSNSLSNLPTPDYSADNHASAITENAKASWLPNEPNLSSSAATTPGQEDLWSRIIAGFQFSQQPVNKRTRREITRYSQHPEDLQRTFERSEPFLYYIVEEAAARGIPMELVLLPVVESAFNPFAYSPRRAAGIWQFIPGTGKHYGLKQSWWYDGRRDVTASTQAAFSYLQTLADKFDGDWLLALAAYNSGAGTVTKAISRNKRHGKPTDYWHLRLPRETMAYVPKLIAIAKIVSEPANHGVSLHPIANEPIWEVTDIDSQIELALAASLADMSVDDLSLYNPGFKRWATDPRGPHQLVIPTDRLELFKTNLANLPKTQRVNWQRYTIRKGDSLSTIAKKFGTSVQAIRDSNKIKGSFIRTGKTLLIPNRPGFADSAYTRASQSTEDNSQQKLTYQVRKGDTLWDISRAYHVSIRKLAEWNKISPAGILQPGQKLIIRTSLWKHTALASTVSGSNYHNAKKIAYQVRRGDSLYRIANKFKVTVNDLVKWNAINPRALLQPEQLLDIFVKPTEFP
jgi:membrane-bound lytic murein transglycosylase D